MEDTITKVQKEDPERDFLSSCLQESILNLWEISVTPVSRPRPSIFPRFWCHACGIDFLSSKALSAHKHGKHHSKQNLRIAHGPRPTKQKIHSRTLPPLEEAELFELLGLGRFRNIVVLTGAGVSTAAGVPDFRSPGGLFDTIRATFGKRFPYVYHTPEHILSREFVNFHPGVYHEEVLPILQHMEQYMNASPTDTHKFCAWLHQQGWLRRLYTQNVDGLHLHPDLGLPTDLVVECHGAVRDGSIVLYGDDLPKRFYSCCDEDFPEIPGQKLQPPIDLILVFGSSLQVFPFCAVPDLAPRGCMRVLVNRSLEDCRCKHTFQQEVTLGMPQSISIGSRKNVSLRNLWFEREGRKRWRQLLVEGDCDDFVQRFFSSPAARKQNISLHHRDNEHSMCDVADAT